VLEPPRYGRDVALRGHLANAAVRVIRDVQISPAIDRNSGKTGKRRRDRRSAIPAETISAIAHHGDDRACRRHLADPVVAGIGDEQVPRGIHGDGNRAIQLGRGRRPTIAAITGRTIARHGADDPPRCGFANSIIADIGKEKVSQRIHGDTLRNVPASRIAELGGRRRAAIAAKTTRAVTSCCSG